MRYLRKELRTPVPQTEKLDERQVENSAGGYSYQVSDWTRLTRFLILGTEGGSYYASQRDLTKENFMAVDRAIKADGVRAVNLIVEISKSGRAPKNDPALFALARAASADNEDTRGFALDALPEVARIGTHLFTFCEFLNSMRGWGRGVRKGVGNWYLNQDANRLAYQLVKYRQRNGWTHRDVLRLAHPKATREEHQLLLEWAAKKTASDEVTQSAFPLIEGYEEAQTADVKRLPALILKYGLTREMLPTEALKSKEVWEALLEKMPMTAMIRNLGVMTSIGLLEPLSAASKKVAARLANEELIHKARVHPIAVLMALRTYAEGRGIKGSKTWRPVPNVVSALDAAFYKAFDNVEPTGKNVYLGVDVSGSMASGSVAGALDLSPRDASAAMAMVIARTEENCVIRAFSGGGWRRGSTSMTDLDINPAWTLEQTIRSVSNLPFGSTDCALPILDADATISEDIDCFIVLTDNETWSGTVHPSQALKDYRKKRGDGKLAVVGMVSNGFSIADPNDAGMLDVVGFDTAAPELITDFMR